MPASARALPDVPPSIDINELIRTRQRVAVGSEPIRRVSVSAVDRLHSQREFLGGRWPPKKPSIEPPHPRFGKWIGFAFDALGERLRLRQCKRMIKQEERLGSDGRIDTIFRNRSRIGGIEKRLVIRAVRSHGHQIERASRVVQVADRRAAGSEIESSRRVQ